jgi:AI-2E family transporter
LSKAPAPKPWIVSAPVPSASLTTLLFVVVIVGCVYVGREVLVPMALAILLSFALAPPVELRSVAVIGVVLFAFAGVFSLGGLMISQVNQLASDLPRYQSTLQEKIKSLRGVAAGSGTLERASEVLQNLSREIDYEFKDIWHGKCQFSARAPVGSQGLRFLGTPRFRSALDATSLWLTRNGRGANSVETTAPPKT